MEFFRLLLFPCEPSATHKCTQRVRLRAKMKVEISLIAYKRRGTSARKLFIEAQLAESELQFDSDHFLAGKNSWPLPAHKKRRLPKQPAFFGIHPD